MHNEAGRNLQVGGLTTYGAFPAGIYQGEIERLRRGLMKVFARSGLPVKLIMYVAQGVRGNDVKDLLMPVRASWPTTSARLPAETASHGRILVLYAQKRGQ